LEVISSRRSPGRQPIATLTHWELAVIELSRWASASTHCEEDPLLPELSWLSQAGVGGGV
jgi:hypothetical protein